MKFTKEKENKIVEMYSQQKNTVEIANEFNTYNTSIRRVLLRKGVKIRTNSEVRKYSDCSKFQTLPLSKEENYYLGLLITDGCIHKDRITLSLKEEDVYMLNNFAKFLGKKVKVNKYFAKAHNKYQYEVKARNREICNSLKKLAIFDDKSNKLRLLTEINFDILRGIIDGDGFIHSPSRCNISIFGNSIEFLKQIQKFYNKYNITSYIHKSKNLYRISVHKQKDLLFLYEKLYYSTDLFLIRKKNKFGPLLKKFSNKLSVNSGNFCQES